MIQEIFLSVISIFFVGIVLFTHVTNNNVLTDDWNVAAFIVNSEDKRVKLPENKLWKSTKIVDKNKESLELKVWISK